MENSSEPAQQDLSVLIVEDFDDAREMYAAYLQYAGFRVLEARDGFEAVSAASRFHPDLILMDLALPRLNGWDATRQIKSNPSTSRTPIIALTAYSDAESHARAVAAGCVTVCPKPCDPDELVTTISAALRETAASGMPSGSAGGQPGAPGPRSQGRPGSR